MCSNTPLASVHAPCSPICQAYPDLSHAILLCCPHLCVVVVQPGLVLLCDEVEVNHFGLDGHQGQVLEAHEGGPTKPAVTPGDLRGGRGQNKHQSAGKPHMASSLVVTALQLPPAGVGVELSRP